MCVFLEKFFTKNSCSSRERKNEKCLQWCSMDTMVSFLGHVLPILCMFSPEDFSEGGHESGVHTHGWLTNGFCSCIFFTW